MKQKQSIAAVFAKRKDLFAIHVIRLTRARAQKNHILNIKNKTLPRTLPQTLQTLPRTLAVAHHVLFLRLGHIRPARARARANRHPFPPKRQGRIPNG